MIHRPQQCQLAAWAARIGRCCFLLAVLTVAFGTAFAAPESADHGEGNPLLRVSPGLWIWTLLVFTGLLIVLYRFGWGKMIDSLDARDKAIRGAIDEARQQHEEAQKLIAEQKALMDKTRHETTSMIAEAEQQAKRERQRIVDEARSESEKIVARGREQIEQEKRAALSEIRRSVADLAVDVSRRMIPEVIDPQTHRSLAERFVQELSKK